MGPNVDRNPEPGIPPSVGRLPGRRGTPRGLAGGRLGVVLLALLLAVGHLAASPRPAEAGVVAGTVGALVGLVAGADVALAVHVARVRMTGWAPLTPDELISLRLEAAPLFVAPVVGAVVGFQSGGLLLHMGLTALGGTGLATAVGIVLGQVVWGGSDGRWAGGIIGGAIGLVVGAAYGFARRRRPIEGTVARES